MDRSAIVLIVVLTGAVVGCPPITGCACEPPPPTLTVYGQVTTAVGDPAPGASVIVQVLLPECQTEALTPVQTGTDGAGEYRVDPFPVLLQGVCIAVQALAAGAPGGTPPTRVTAEIAEAPTKNDSVRVDVRLP